MQVPPFSHSGLPAEGGKANSILVIDNSTYMFSNAEDGRPKCELSVTEAAAVGTRCGTAPHGDKTGMNQDK